MKGERPCQDVYKRQLQRIDAGFVKGEVFCGGAAFHKAVVEDDVVPDQHVILTAVSYTHLAEYKSQAVRRRLLAGFQCSFSYFR